MPDCSQKGMKYNQIVPSDSRTILQYTRLLVITPVQTVY